MQIGGVWYGTECDVSVSKLLGFETFQFFWMVSDSVMKKFGFKKVLDSVLEKIGIEKSFGFGFVQILGIVTH